MRYSTPPLVEQINGGNWLDPQEAEELRDELFYQRAIHAYMTMLPALNVIGMRDGSEAAFGAGYHVLPIWKERMPSITGRPGATRTSSSIWRSSAISTAKSTTRRSTCSTRARPCARSRTRSSCPRAWPPSGRIGAITARSTTTSPRPTCSTSAGSTAIRRRSTSCRRSRRAGTTSNSWAAPTRCSRRQKQSFGDYRWVAEVVNHVVFADPDNQAAKDLQADALEQLGYQSESGPWRNFYLIGAQELRNGVHQLPTPDAASPDTVRAMSPEMFFDFLGGEGGQYVLELSNGVLNHTADAQADDADATSTLSRSTLNDIILQQKTAADAVSSGDIQVEGDQSKLEELVSYLDTFEFWFNIVTPNVTN